MPKTAPSFFQTPPRFYIVAIGCLLIYLVLTLFYNIPTLAEPRLNRELLVWPVTLGLLYLYWAGYQAVRAEKISMRWIVAVGVGLAALAVFTPPFHSTDIFGYINRGWQQLHYGLNPYVYTVDHIPGWENDPMITDHWVNNPSPYGFLYLLWAKALCWLGGGNKAMTIWIFKASNALIHAAIAGLIWLGVNRLSQTGPSSWRERMNPNLALYLYLWSPLVLVHGLINGHNDMVMGLFVTLSAALGIFGQWLWLLPALMAATLVKYGAVVIAPVAAVFLIRQKAWRALVGGVIFALLVFGVTGIPFLPDWQDFHLSAINKNAFVSHGSLHSFLYTITKTIDEYIIPGLHPYRETIRALMKNALLGTYALFFTGLLFMRFGQAKYPVIQWVWDSLLVMAVLVCLISLKYYPWYLGMFFPLAFFLPEGDWLRRTVILLSAMQLFSITFIGQAHILNFLIMTGLPVLYIFREYKRGNITPTVFEEGANY